MFNREPGGTAMLLIVNLPGCLAWGPAISTLEETVIMGTRTGRQAKTSAVQLACVKVCQDWRARGWRDMGRNLRKYEQNRCKTTREWREIVH